MRWKSRSREIKRLRRKHGGTHGVVSIPELQPMSATPCAPSLSKTGVAKIVATPRVKPSGSGPSNAFVGTPHKQGPMVMFRSELPWAGGKKS